MKILLAILLFLVVCTAKAGSGVMPCAIRWDAYGAPVGGFSNTEVTRALNPPQYQSRAPFFASKRGGKLVINSTQESMDQEITYAAASKIACWAFFWHRSPVNPTHEMQRAWDLYQASLKKDEIKWTQMEQFSLLLGPADFDAQIPTIVGYFKQSNYFKVAGNRPVWWLYLGNLKESLKKNWSGDPAKFAAVLTRLRAATQSAGLGNPYVVAMGFSSGPIASALGADALSNYIPDVGKSQSADVSPYDALTERMERYSVVQDSEAVAHSLQHVPITALCWDTRPRKENPPAWQARGEGYKSLQGYSICGGKEQITAHLTAFKNFVLSKATTTAPYKLALVYAWNECDEGGGCLVPAFNEAKPLSPNATYLDAFDAVDW